MDIGTILTKVGGAVIKDVVPGGALLVDVVNSFLPDDRKLPEDTTGEQVRQAVKTLPPDRRAELLSKKVDVELAQINSWTQIQATLAEADRAGASTRPFIAKMMAWCVVYAIVIFISMWGVMLWAGDADKLKALADAWPLMLAVLGTPTALLRSYFGARTREKKSRYAAAVGQPPQPNPLADIIRAVRG